MTDTRLTITTPDGSFTAYVARPAMTPAPVIVVIQEIFGVNATMRGICDDLAAKGYVAVCPDLFWRIEPGIDITDKTEAEMKRAFELYGLFNVETGVSDIAATLAAVLHLPDSNGKVGALGYCLGGLLAALTAFRSDSTATVSYYGVGIENFLAEATHLKHPLLLHIAGADQFVPLAAQDKLLAAASHSALMEAYRYDGEHHAFARVGGQHYSVLSATLANERTTAFFKRYLG